MSEAVARSSCGMLILDRKTQVFIYGNDKIFSMSGQPRERLLGNSLSMPPRLLVCVYV